MLRKLLLLVLVLAVLGAAVFWFVTSPQTVAASALAPRQPDLANGATMFNAGGCASCHATPKQDDKARLGGGRALPSPFGTFYVPNISSDPKDGIGSWTEAQFVTAMLKGTSPDGSHYYPAFPYTSYQRMRLEDVRDLYAHMKSLPAVQGRVREHDVPFPFNIRRLLGGWKFLFVDGESFRPDAAQSAQWNRGAYLVNGPGHCAECHSPRHALGAVIESQRFAGGPEPVGDGWVPNITQHGLSAWSVEDIAKLLTTGENRDSDTVGGDMALVVGNTAKLSDDDRNAMAAYVKFLPALQGPQRPARK
jgi:mono/diheme cytochrome c family protein